MKTNFKKALFSFFVVVMCLTIAPLQGDIGFELSDWNLPDFEIGNLFSTTAKAETAGYYTYTVENGEATITDVDTSISGDITIPSTLGGYPVTSIGEYAFYYCNNLKKITIPNSVTSIADYVFMYCTSLTNITIPDSVTSIGEAAFSYCTSLTSITIPDSVTSICDFLFVDCTSLTSITIPDSVTNIGTYAFDNTAYYNNDANWSNGVLYIGKHLIATKSDELLGTYSIKKGTKTIAGRAFEWCDSLTNITIPDSVTSIGSESFYRCVKLTSITIPDSVINIGDWAFNSCDSLTSITLPDSITSIGSSAFSYTAYVDNDENWSNGVLYIGKHLIEANSSKISDTYSIKKGTKTIADYAFWQCFELTDITIPDSLTSIGDCAFAYCDSLTNIKVDKNNAYYFSDSYGVLFNKNKTELIKYSCGNTRTSYSIPESVTSIEAYAFRYSNNLTSITIPNSVTSIGHSAFSYCNGLKRITIPDSVTNIGVDAFWNCTGLTSITISDSVTSIGTSTFSGCTSLKSITIPDSVKSIDEDAFNNCSSLTNITIPDSVKYIDVRAFCNCDSLTNITIPDSVKYIGGCAFGYCTSLKSIIIPNSVTSIEEYTFTDCSSLESITIPDSVTSIGYDAFSECGSLANVYYSGTKMQWGKIDIYEGNENLTSATIHYNYCDHEYTTTTTKATLTNNGSMKTACAACGDVKSETAISSPKTFTLSATSYTFNGTVRTPTVTVKDYAGKVLTKGTDYTVTYATGRKDAGTYNVTVKMIGNYTGTKTLSFKINPIDISTCIVKLSATSYTFNGNVRTPTVTVTNSYGTKLTKDKHYTVTYASGRKNAGTYNVTVKMTGNYTGTKTLSFKINPINISTCKVKLSATSLTYNGNVRTPTVTVTNSYGTKLTKDKHYTVTYATGRKNVGTYKVTVKMIGNYTGTKTLSFKINPINISTCKVKLSATSLTYNGNVRTPTVTVTNSYGTKLTKDKHYTVTYATGRKNVGTYKVTVKMIGNYTGTKTISFKINPMDISKCTVKLSATSLTYNGNVRTPTVTITNANGAKFTKDTHYTVKYATGRKNVGTYKVTVTMKGNYKGTKTLTFKINPPKTTVSSLSAAKKSITVAVAKKTTQVTGYQIQYSTSKNFTNAKTKTITSYNTTKTTLSNLTSAKTYYVRVRTYKTVGDVKYYSGWSAYKYVQTK